jgi:hypothetical protein
MKVLVFGSPRKKVGQAFSLPGFCHIAWRSAV